MSVVALFRSLGRDDTRRFHHYRQHARGAPPPAPLAHAQPAQRSTTMALPAQDIVLAEENNVRLAENAVTTTAFFLFFWASFGVSWLVSKRIVPQFKSFSAVEKADWCSRVNSTIHAVFVIIGVGLALAHIQWGEDHLPVSSLRMASFVFSFAIGYFLCDLMIILIWPVPMQSVFVIHHVVAVIPYFINNFIACCAACQYGLLLFLLVELATLPLNVRGFIESIGSDPSKNHTRAIYATYFIWAISRTLLPIYLIYVFWTDAFPSDRNQDVCLYPSMVSAHIIALFCVGVFFFVHTPEIMERWRSQPSKPTNEESLTAATDKTRSDQDDVELGVVTDGADNLARRA